MPATRPILLALLASMLALPLVAAQEADSAACERQWSEWIAEVATNTSAAEGGFACRVQCVNGLWASMNSGDPVVVDAPTVCAVRSGETEPLSDAMWVSHGATPALARLAGPILSTTQSFALVADGLVLHAEGSSATPA